MLPITPDAERLLVATLAFRHATLLITRVLIEYAEI